MRFLRSLFPDLSPFDNGGGRRLAAMMGLFFLVVCAVGILRPIKNALALDGLGATDFYRVYLVSAAVVLFVPAYNVLADRFGARRLIPLMALFFALNLVGFRLAFQEGSALLGMLFYGWYDLFAAVLVSQFFMATQLFFNAQNAKHAYPLVVAGGSVGATLGGAITGFFAETVGTANLLLVAAALIAGFGLSLPLVWGSAAGAEARPPGVRSRERISARGAAGVFRNPHVRLIAASVLLAVVVKQLVDYQFNALTLQVFQTADAVSAFQGKFNAATQWLPLVVVLALRPLMRRWGVGTAVLLLPGTMLLATLGLALWWGLAAVVAAKAADAALRYSAERTGREVLYVPVPQEIKLQAKSYIDVAIEKGVGKVVSAGLIFLLLLVLEPRQLTLATAGLSLLWLGVAVGIRAEYVRALARSIQGRFASLRGIGASLSDASSQAVVRRALTGADPLQITFVLDLLEQAGEAGVRPFARDLGALLDSPEEEVRVRALAVLARHPAAVDEARVRARLADPSAAVRQAAVRVLCAARPAERDAILGELLRSPEAAVRTAALTCLALGEITTSGARLVAASDLERWRPPGRSDDRQLRVELALAAGALRFDRRRSEDILEPLLADPDAEVASAALRSAGLTGEPRYHPHLVAALGRAAVRAAARDALVRQGPAVVPVLSEHLLDPDGVPAVRRQIPAVLSRIPAQDAVEALLSSFVAPETDQLLDYRTLKALNKLRVRHPGLVFGPSRVMEALDRELAAAVTYAAARRALDGLGTGGRSLALLRRSLAEAWAERREGVFRCLGLLHPPRDVYRCYQAVAVRGAGAARANALEWLEQTVGHRLFDRLAPVVRSEAGIFDPRHSDADAVLRRLCSDGDTWIACCALHAAVELRPAWAAEQLSAACASPHPDLRCLAGQLSARLLRAGPSTPTPPDTMDLVEKVFLLQQVDLLQDARSAHLALLASIAEEVEVEPGVALVRQGETPEALYVVIRGAAELRATGGPQIIASDGMSFGTWALIDDEASLVEARAAEPTRLLRIHRDDFHDLLADHSELAVGLLQGLARRVRALVA